MKREIFTRMLERVYSTFGRTVPVGEILTAIWLRAQDIPDEAAPAIADGLCDEDRLPSNMGKALYAGWMDWMQRNPARIVAERGCKNCEEGWICGWSQTPGWDTKRLMHWVAPCGDCRPTAYGAKTRAEALASGAVVMPVNYPGGAMAFDRDNGLGVLFVLRDKNSGARWEIPQNVDTRPDMRRLSGLTERELADVAGGF